MMCEGEPPKKVKKPPKHEFTVVLLDVGSNMRNSVAGTSSSALDYGKEIVDWILTRKIFTESPDEFVLVFFGSEETRNSFSSNVNIVFCEEEMQTAKIDWLRLLQKEVKPSENVEGDFLTALIEGVNFLRSSLENAPEDVITGTNILLVTNLEIHNSGEKDQDLEAVEAIVRGISALNTTFNVVGPAIRYWNMNNEEDGSGNNEEFAKEKLEMTDNEMLLGEIVRRCRGVSYSFDEALNMLGRFIPRHVVARGQRFLFQIGMGVKLPLIFYKKVQLADMNLKFKKFDASTNTEVVRESVFEKIEDSDIGGKVETNDSADNILLTKDDIVRGYTFGSTIVPFNDADKQEYSWKREVRTLDLIQFARRSEIFQHYLMDGSAYYCLPPPDDEVGCTAVSALVRGLIKEDCIAIARYVYNAASLPRLLALFPRMSMKGVDMFVGIQLPFYEEFRGLEFPSVTGASESVKAEQSRAMEALVSAMDLSKAHFDFEMGEYAEGYRPKDVPNPKIQRLCEAVKFRALNPGGQLPQPSERILTGLLAPQPRLLKLANEPLLWIKKRFNLHEIKKTKNFSENTDPAVDDSLLGFDKSDETLPESGRFITVKEVKKEVL